MYLSSEKYPEKNLLDTEPFMKEMLDIALLVSSLLFYADYDTTFDAAYSKGHGQATVVADRYPPTLTTGNGGRYGEAASFTYNMLDLDTVWTKDVLRYQANGNFPHDSMAPFDGAVGMWIQVDIDSLMSRKLIWLDPVHLLSNDRDASRDAGKIWMDIVTKELKGAPIFRFGATLPRDARSGAKAGDGHG